MTVPLFTPLFRESYNLCKPPVIGSYSTPFKAGVGRHFDPRSPRGERLVRLTRLCQPVRISIHAPREGSDSFLLVEGFLYPNFYPRSP